MDIFAGFYRCPPMVNHTLLGGGEDLRLDLLGHRIRHPRRLDPRLDRCRRSRGETQDLDRKKSARISKALKIRVIRHLKIRAIRHLLLDH